MHGDYGEFFFHCTTRETKPPGSSQWRSGRPSISDAVTSEPSTFSWGLYASGAVLPPSCSARWASRWRTFARLATVVAVAETPVPLDARYPEPFVRLGRQLPELPFAVRAKEVLEMAARGALTLGSRSIETKHILLGAVREAESIAMPVLLARDTELPSSHDERFDRTSPSRSDTQSLGAFPLLRSGRSRPSAGAFCRCCCALIGHRGRSRSDMPA